MMVSVSSVIAVDFLIITSKVDDPVYTFISVNEVTGVKLTAVNVVRSAHNTGIKSTVFPVGT